MIGKVRLVMKRKRRAYLQYLTCTHSQSLWAQAKNRRAVCPSPRFPSRRIPTVVGACATLLLPHLWAQLLNGTISTSSVLLRSSLRPCFSRQKHSERRSFSISGPSRPALP